MNRRGHGFCIARSLEHSIGSCMVKVEQREVRRYGGIEGLMTHEGSLPSGAVCV